MDWTYGLGFSDKEKIDANTSETVNYSIIKARCLACHKVSYWLKKNGSASSSETLIYPEVLLDAPEPNTDMPEDIKQVYLEAAKIIKDSPRASAALSRLAIEKLTKKLIPNKNSLNERIAALVKKGLSKKIQQSLDIVRIIGNNAVHPGEIDLTDNSNMATSLLSLLNVIVEEQISTPKRIEQMYNDLPQGNLKSIQKRDQTKT